MQNTARALKVGALLVAACIAAVLLWRTLFRRDGAGQGYQVHAILQDATGLVPHSRVMTAGIAVGEIERISLAGDRARVDVRVRNGVRLYRNATVAKRAVSVLGEFQLVLAPGTEDRGPPLTNGERIGTVVEAATTDQVITNVAAITERLRQVSDQLAAAFGTNEGGREMQETLRNIAELTRAVNRTVQDNSSVIAHTLQNVDTLTTQAQPDIRASLANLRDATERIDRILGRHQPAGHDTVADVQEATRNVAGASRELRETLEHLNSISGTVDRGEGNIGRMVRDEALVDEVQGTAEALNDVVQPIARLQTIVGLRSEYNFIANTLKSYVELRLQPREDKYYLLELIDDPRGLTRTTSTITDTTDPSSTPHYRTIQRETTDAFRFSFMFARRIGPVTFRFGIMESTGGAGADLHLFDDRLELRTDLFNFGENTNPRLRLRLAYEIVRRAWIFGGLDDILNPERSDYFLGAQLRFNDEDIKSILPFLGGFSSR
ncbi:MAG: MCE family protein [Deltaproteobacteria bacterium]|nr:MCE family protein [Deltaproteobacteria bacterium]